MTLPETDQARLAKMRAQNEQWQAIEPNAKYWDTTFLLKIIERLIKERNKNE
jgi:hypothetical protein